MADSRKRKSARGTRRKPRGKEPAVTEPAAEAYANRPDESAEDRRSNIRPRRLSDFVGQQRMHANLRVFVNAAKGRDKSMDHVILHGPPGLGKTTLAHIIANELGVGLRVSSGPALVRAGDLAAILTNLAEGDVLFIDEIHRLNPSVEESLYPALEDFELDIIVGEGPAARAWRIPVKPFTLIGATTRLGMVNNALRDRFGIDFRLQYYDEDELTAIVTRAAATIDCAVEPDGAREIARRSRGTPRIAIRLLSRIADFQHDAGATSINCQLASQALLRLEVDDDGLDAQDRRYLDCLARNFNGGPVGLDTLAASLSEDRDTLEDVVEPFLLQQGFIQRTSRGRVLTVRGWKHLGLTLPPGVDPAELLL